VATLLLTMQAVHGFVYSCNEVKDRLVNRDKQWSTTHACVSLADGYYAFDDLDKIILLIEDIWSPPVSVSLAAVAASPGGCIKVLDWGGSFRIVADPTVSLRCDKELALIFSSPHLPYLIPVGTKETGQSVSSGFNRDLVFVNPRGGILMEVGSCDGDGDVTLFTGAGMDIDEHRFPMKTWR
ncbi:hypothetical protein PFISCL1PPCAC_9233, partial [Pristionchus fissidentatus]